MFNEDTHREFQRGIDPQAGKTKRHEDRLNLRREIRSKHLNKRRKELTNETDNKTSTSNNNDKEPESSPTNITTNTQEVIPTWVNINNLGKFAEQMASSDINDIFQSVQAIRQLLSVPQKPPIEQVFASGVVPKMLQIVCRKIDIKDRQNISPLEEKRIKLQFEASWALTNIASGESVYTHKLVDMGCIDALVTLLKNTQDKETIDQAIWCLGNIAGDGCSLRDKVLQSGVLEFMIDKLDSFPENMKRNTVWTISNFCRGKPPPDWEKISKVIPPLASLLVQTKDYDVTVDILWALSFLSEGREENEANADSNENNSHHHYQIDAILQTGVMKYIITLVKHAQQLAQDAFAEINELKIQAANENPSRDIEIPNQIRQKLTTSDFLIAPCVRIMGNIVSGNDEQTLEVVKAGFFDIVETCLDHRVKNIKKESCWALSNVVAGLHEHIDLFFQRENLIEKVIKLCIYDDVNVRKEAGWCLSNAICSASFAQAQVLVKHGFIEAMVQLLTFDAEKVVMMAMEALHECIINYNRHFKQPDNAFNKWAGKMEEVNGLEYLERIQGAENFSEACFELAASFVTKFWGDPNQFNETEDTDENEMGKGDDNQSFTGLNDDAEIGNNTDPYQF